MSVRKTLENMQTALDNAYDSIEQMGGVTPQSRNMVNLAGTIDNLNNTVIAGVRGTNDAYDPDNKDYAIGESCIYNNVVYLAKVAITKPAGAFDPSKWNESSLASLRGAISNAISDINDLFSQKMYFRQETAYHGSVEDTLVWLYQNHPDWLNLGNIIQFMRQNNSGSNGILIPGGPNYNYNTILEFSYYDDRNINMYRMVQGVVESSRTI